LDLVRTVTDQRERTALTWDLPAQECIGRLAGVAGAALAAAGIGRLVRARRWKVLSVVAVAGAFEVYLRVLRPFPYGEFKLLTSVWSLAVCLVALGAAEAGRAGAEPSAKCKVHGAKGGLLRPLVLQRRLLLGKSPPPGHPE